MSNPWFAALSNTVRHKKRSGALDLSQGNLGDSNSMMMLNPNQNAIEQYCQENNVRVAPSSIWKL